MPKLRTTSDRKTSELLIDRAHRLVRSCLATVAASRHLVTHSQRRIQRAKERLASRRQA